MTKTLLKNPKTTRDTESRQRFLEAAEYLFAKHGYEGTKIRAIAERSKVNLGALHHYWGSKDELFTAVCERRLVPMNEERLRRIEQAVDEAKGKAIDIRALFRASIEPTFFLSGLNEEEQIVFRKFYGRVLTEPSPIVSEVMIKIFRPVSKRFFELLKELCFHLSEDEFYWRANCLLGVYLSVPAFNERIAIMAHDDFNINDNEQCIAQVVEFLVAGMQASSIDKQ